MINDIFSGGAETETHRMLAVVGGRAERSREVIAQFEALGEVVEARWFETAGALLSQSERPRFEAVILFPECDDAATDADEANLRGALTDTPLYRVA